MMEAVVTARPIGEFSGVVRAVRAAVAGVLEQSPEERAQ
jgi:hypothetical protein